MDAHTSKVYEAKLRGLRSKLQEMGQLVFQMLSDAEIALRTRDAPLATATILSARLVHRLECDVDERAMTLLATRQPVASDLRLITAALKIVTDLERMGDLSTNVCERMIELNAEPALPAMADIIGLTGEVVGVVREALMVWADPDDAAARALLRQDATIDAHYRRIFQDMVDLMAKDPTAVGRATRVQSIAKYLERIADHAMNIAKNVVFVVTGVDVRHPE
jgi:phosphate transport system protein